MNEFKGGLQHRKIK